MTKKSIKTIYVLPILIIILLFSFSIFYKKSGENINYKNIEAQNSASLNINESIYTTNIFSEDTVESFMQRLKDEKKINYKTKTYIGMGKFVEEINGIKTDGQKYWIFYVNGEKSNIGISNYKIKNGDIISWKYEKNIY